MHSNKLKIKSRFYVNDVIQEKLFLVLDKQVSHHLITVLRANLSEYIRVYNEKYGEFNAEIISIKKQEVVVKILSQHKTYTPSQQHIHLAFAPLKKDANDIVLTKATELGIHEITYVITNRTVNKPLDSIKSLNKVTQASQQCERLDIPKVNPPCSLNNFLSKNSPIFWLNENKLGTTLTKRLNTNMVNNPIFLIGPEGGFSNEEYSLLESIKTIYPIYFNNNILRAETACITALTIYQSIVGNL